MNGILSIKKEDFNELIDILESKGLKLSINFNPFFNDISFYDSTGYELFLRSSYDKYITIVRICLKHRRQGLCTQIVNWLMNYAKAHDFKGVKIESVCSKEMDNFCKKNKFKRTNMGMEMNSMWYGDYILRC